MQSQNNGALKKYFTKERVLVYLIIFILFSVFVSLKMTDTTQTTTEAPTGRYTDPFSGQTVTRDPDKALDTYGAPKDEAILLGISTLLDHGLTSDQLAILQTSFQKYANINDIYEIAVEVDKISSLQNEETGGYTYEFPVMTNRADRHTARVETIGIDAARLLIFNPDKKLEYDSRTQEVAPIDAD